LLLFCFLAAAALAGQPEEGAVENERIGEAIAAWRSIAENGDREAQFSLGDLYHAHNGASA
jgi:hypothetical protein